MRLPVPVLCAVTASLLLSACGGGGSSTPAPSPPDAGPICTQAVASSPMQVQSVPAAAVGAPDWSAPRVLGRVLLLGADSLAVQSVTTLSGVVTQAVTDGVRLAFTPAGTDDRAFAVTLQQAGLRAQPDFLYAPLANPNDPGVPGNAGVPISGAGTFTQSYLTRVRAPQAWTFLQGCGKTPVAAKTAILDSKVEAGHPDLTGRVAGSASFLSPDSGGSDTSTGHGTASAGLVGAATNNGRGVAGVTWSGPLLAVEVLGAAGGSTSDLARGLNESVRQGAKVINMSLGLAGDPGDAVLAQALTDAARSAVLVAAAGNTAGDGVYYPASHPDVIAVGAVAQNDGQLACYSARPSAARPRGLNIVAPGGAGNCAGATNAAQMLILAPGGGYTLGAGTSFAAPLVSGVAALMRAANPTMSAAETKARLLGSVNRAAGQPLLDANAAVRAATR
ncbi:S8 family peptidase [Deinococcus sp. UR1]|uniref:S8 family peptidase n=1 Tax=Deinococcus sp. UR1 TaxID=1704277 RepID=UPI000ACC14F4|nr:S8 family serine peptidase [Deinococcus sp. UR1]PIG99734.1 peptidase S8 [Deinococcus sp. UR1]